MAFNVVKKQADGTYALDTTERSFIDKSIDCLKAPINAFTASAEDEFVSKRESGMNVLVWAGIAGLAGELIGYRGARSGRKALLANIPMFA